MFKIRNLILFHLFWLCFFELSSKELVLECKWMESQQYFNDGKVDTKTRKSLGNAKVNDGFINYNFDDKAFKSNILGLNNYYKIYHNSRNDVSLDLIDKKTEWNFRIFTGKDTDLIGKIFYDIIIKKKNFFTTFTIKPSKKQYGTPYAGIVSFDCEKIRKKVF